MYFIPCRFLAEQIKTLLPPSSPQISHLSNGSWKKKNRAEEMSGVQQRNILIWTQHKHESRKYVFNVRLQSIYNLCNQSEHEKFSREPCEWKIFLENLEMHLRRSKLRRQAFYMNFCLSITSESIKSIMACIKRVLCVTFQTLAEKNV